MEPGSRRGGFNVDLSGFAPQKKKGVEERNGGQTAGSQPGVRERGGDSKPGTPGAFDFSTYVSQTSARGGEVAVPGHTGAVHPVTESNVFVAPDATGPGHVTADGDVHGGPGGNSDSAPVDPVLRETRQVRPLIRFADTPYRPPEPSPEPEPAPRNTVRREEAQRERDRPRRIPPYPRIDCICGTGEEIERIKAELRQRQKEWERRYGRRR